ncbi:MAG: hypothetical protein JNK15_12015 [Planctomycetes bacterium]|nr:hypothetical protein [Planctomycetota bacterium]
MTIARILCATSLLLAALPAQGKPSPFRFVPANSIAVVRMAAPAAWQQQFQTAQITKWFQSDSLAPLVGMLSQGVDQGMAAVRESGKFDADLLEKLLHDYKGEIVLSLQLDVAGLVEAMQQGEDPPMSMTLALMPDGAFDLAALAKAAEKAIDEDAPPTRDLTVGDHKLRGMLDGGGDGMTVPQIIDGALVVFGGDGLEEKLPKLLADEGRWQGDAAPHALSVEMKFGAAVSTFAKFVDDMGAAPISVATVFEKAGFSALEDLSFTIDADGKHVVGAMNIGFGAGNRGIFDAFMGGSTPPKSLRYVPPTSDSFSISAFKLGVLYDVVASVWGELGDEVPMTFADVEKAFADATKVRLKEDLIAHLGDEIVALQDMQAMAAGAAAADEDDPLAGMQGMCLAITLRDGKAFGESLETALRSRGMHAGRKTEEYEGTKVHRLAVGGLFEIEYATTDDLLLVGLGKDDSTKRALRSLLDGRKSPGDGSVPAGIKDAVAAMPAGWSGIQVTRMSTYMSAMLTAMQAGMDRAGEMPEEATMVFGALTKAAGDLGRLGLDALIATTYATPKGFVSRFRW